MATVISGTTGISANAAQFLIGQVVFMAGANAPSGFLKCNGQLVSRTTYASLFAVIGTTYGAGDGATTFNLPDLRGEFVRCFDDGKGTDAGRAFGSAQAGSVEAHTHYQRGNPAPAFAPGSTYTAADASNATNMGVTGSYGGTETRPRNIALLACIFSGV